MLAGRVRVQLIQRLRVAAAVGHMQRFRMVAAAVVELRAVAVAVVAESANR
jgi:hypothetical protein